MDRFDIFFFVVFIGVMGFMLWRIVGPRGGSLINRLDTCVLMTGCALTYFYLLGSEYLIPGHRIITVTLLMSPWIVFRLTRLSIRALKRPRHPRA